jgi:hypothetical protein
MVAEHPRKKPITLTSNLLNTYAQRQHFALAMSNLDAHFTRTAPHDHDVGVMDMSYRPG